MGRRSAYSERAVLPLRFTTLMTRTRCYRTSTDGRAPSGRAGGRDEAPS